MPQPASASLAFDDVRIDFPGRRLLRGGNEQPLEPKAFDVLALLAGTPGQVFTRDEILDAVFPGGSATTVDTYVHYIRRKSTPELIETVRARGYRSGAPR